ncbi:anti-sigma factor domain-containing protein [Actinacidiphila glaucinigra]|uniref:anti-sigma factor n=1 Tax=Actinacidiphila glaucinigra TaxID=235986 RepID=UPI0036E35344
MRGSVHELAAAYVLDTLAPRELRRFERHLMRCDACADRVRRLAGDTVRLGAGASAVPAPPPMPPPALVPLPEGGAPDDRDGPGVPAGEDAPDDPAPGRWWWRTRRRPTATRLAAAGAGAALLACAVLGALLLRTTAQLDRQRGDARAVNEVLTAADARPVYSSDDHGRGVTAVVSRRMRRAVVTVHGLPPLEGRDVYQLWLVSERPTSFRSLGVLGPDPAADGTSGPVVTGGLDEWSYAFTVTVEPTGGSPVPSSDAVAQLPLLALGIGS